MGVDAISTHINVTFDTSWTVQTPSRVAKCARAFRFEVQLLGIQIQNLKSLGDMRSAGLSMFCKDSGSVCSCCNCNRNYHQPRDKPVASLYQMVGIMIT